MTAEGNSMSQSSQPPGDSRQAQQWRVSRKHAGEGIENGYNAVGVMLLGLGIVALALALIAGGYGYAGLAAVAGVVCAVLFLGGGAVIVAEWRRRRSRDGLIPEVRQGH
ncbi:hypothetical protein ACQP0C_23515 [Nocardia sp. CA-129566]|uniref:hypothetical protein n=1 Tax=Nocardia sp. CA-129566 TaxID=3239976 RepID=UPI003D95AA75